MFKSIKTSVVALILIGTAVIAKAQKVIEQGTITYGIEYVLTEDQKKAIDVSVLPSESKVQFNGTISKVEIDMGMAMVKVITDAAAKNALLLIDVPMMQKQFATKMNKADLEKQSGNMKLVDLKASGEKQTIAGYQTEKYTYKDNNGTAYEIWVSTDLKFSPGAIPPEFAELKGTPVKYTAINEGIKTVLTLKSVKEEKVGPFTLEVPKGYELKTMAEMEAMRNGGE
ncbi:DUF4412 domain-containing protein [Pedobacter metabolipauper]|uniref:Uncharacterized protein DUF4412 n=1 Tax=Pedobacter metabolipauper TaxID=425513 RepID=A0A4R6SX98_9SPHI|nr:DUF4412 domain-containing protein [Pedobacter metabolipauper]TDQ11144.1 uncharacterized protein DUF4412 [Pedobacter metabolipauper]